MPFPPNLQQSFLALAVKLNVRAEDVEEHFIRGTGKGGQKINKTSSAVHLIHKPTGTEVKVQDYRERPINRGIAYRRLLRKIEEQKLGAASKNAQRIFKLRKQKAKRSKRAKEKMLEEKHHRAEIKEGRKPMI